MDDEACKIKEFILYVYNYSSSGIGREKYQVETGILLGIRRTV